MFHQTSRFDETCMCALCLMMFCLQTVDCIVFQNYFFDWISHYFFSGITCIMIFIAIHDIPPIGIKTNHEVLQVMSRLPTLGLTLEVPIAKMRICIRITLW